MTTHRGAFPVVFVTGALLVAVTTCLTVSYAGIEESPRDMGKVAQTDDLPKGQGEGHAWFGGQEEARAEQIEHEDEVAHLAERAEEAREEVEDEREEQKSSTGQERAGAAVLGAHIEVINTRDASSGTPPNPCIHSVSLPPMERQLELRATLRSVNGTDETIHTLREVAIPNACSIQGDFYVDRQSAPARILLCPDTCAWARTTSHKLSVDVFVAGP